MKPGWEAHPYRRHVLRLLLMLGAMLAIMLVKGYVPVASSSPSPQVPPPTPHPACRPTPPAALPSWPYPVSPAGRALPCSHAHRGPPLPLSRGGPLPVPLPLPRPRLCVLFAGAVRRRRRRGTRRGPVRVIR